MSDPLPISKVEPVEVGFGSFVTPAHVAESSKPGFVGRLNPNISPATSSHSQRTDSISSITELMSTIVSETPSHTVMLINTERPKSGLTKTKRNLKDQLLLKMAALDDGRQTPNLPSPHLNSEDAKVSSTCAITSTVPAVDESTVQTTNQNNAKQTEPNISKEIHDVTITVKTEPPDVDFPVSSNEPVNSSTEPPNAIQKTAVSEDTCMSPNDAISQSGTEVAGPTKWIIGDMLWARVSGHPWWPCMVAYDPTHTAFTRTLKRRQGSLVQYHVQFFGDEGERGWINESSIIPFEGLDEFTKFCQKMISLHKKERQNYIVPARRLKAWNVAVKSAEEAYPMTRVFRVHRFAFVYDQPVVANGSTAPVAGAGAGAAEGTQQNKKGVKRSRSSSLGSDGQPRKWRRLSGEKSISSPATALLKACCFSPKSRMSDSHDRETSFSSDGLLPEPGSAVFRSRAEGVKRSSRFVKPTNRIMEHLEEVQQRRRVKLRPYRKVLDFSTSSEPTSETSNKIQEAKSQDDLTTPDEAVPETLSDLVDKVVHADSTEKTEAVSEHSQENVTMSDSPEKMDVESSDKLADATLPKPVITDTVVSMEKTTMEASVAEQADSTVTETVCAADAVVKVELESSAEESPLNLTESLNEKQLSGLYESEESALPSQRNEEPSLKNHSPCDEEVLFPPMNLSTSSLLVPLGLNETADIGKVCSSDVNEAVYMEKAHCVQKRQKKASKRSKGLAVCHEAVKADVKMADEHVSLPMDVVSSLNEPSSSNPPPENQRKPPGRRKSRARIRSVSEDEVQEKTAPAADANIADGILTCSPQHSRFRTGSRSQPEFQRLNSGGLHQADEVCHICEQSGDVLIDCQGPCFGSYHLSCLGLIVSPVGSFRCDECSTGNHPCFVCKHTSRDTIACNSPKCGRFYHRDCVSKFPLCKSDTNSFICPLHTCATCAAESGKNGRASKGPMYKCIRCPTAYHANDFCIAAGTVVIAGYNIICNNHLLVDKSSKRGTSHVNAMWCFVCSQESSSLVQCSSCPVAFHAACAKIGQVTNPWQCKDCTIGKRPLYGEVVWAKIGNYRWWPGEVCHSDNLSDEILNKPHETGQFVVRLFGVGFHFWLQQGRVFPFHDNDQLSREPAYKKLSEVFERAVSDATEVYRLRLAAREAKTNSEREKNDQKPAYYKHVKVNLPLGDVEIYKIPPSEIPSCHCSPEMENPCGPDSDCINRLMMYECNILVCPAGESCQNQRFQKREDADVRPYKTEHRGWGLRCRSDIAKGQFIAEYVGDLVDPEECNRRLEHAQRNNITNFYMLTLDKNRIIDAGPKGNYTRFMNHSCEPNCETQKWTVNGDIRVGLFTLHDVPAGTELTFNYNLDCYGNQKTVCKCGASICSGFLGVRPKTAAAANVERKSREAKLKKQLKVLKSKDRPDVCYSCKKKGGELVICENAKCLKAYHLRCLRPQHNGEEKFICPWHRCETCSLDASKLCSICPRSFCPLHLTGNIFEISDGSLVCSKHQDILSSCLQDSWNSSTLDRINTGSNGFSSAPVPLANQADTTAADNSTTQKQGRAARKRTAANSNVIQIKAAEEADGDDTSRIPQLEPKQRRRQVKKAVNGCVEEDNATVEGSKVDDDTSVTKPLKDVPTRRSKAGTRSLDKNASEGSSVVRRKKKALSTNVDAQNICDRLQMDKQLELGSLNDGLRLKDETLNPSFSNSVSVRDVETVRIGSVSAMNSPENSTVISEEKSDILKDGCTEQEEFPRLLIDDSF